jgi:hypothetical protein
MKTTMDIADTLIRKAKRHARQHGLAFRRLLEWSIRQFLTEKRSPRKPFQLERCSFRGDGVIETYTWPDVRAKIYEGRGE